ncbi:MAG: beta-ketoacyl synthase chain length factor [Pseudomonadota bacterium]|nr:beta-ketoacyl synthase chain length factor [Pseudomonadota bacterium]
MSRLSIELEAVGLFAPGWPDWAAARDCLRGQAPVPDMTDVERYPPPAGLPKNERRRSSRITRIAFAACEDALAASSRDRSALRTVFASCSGDMDIVDDICRALTREPVALSPTQFHNSVHNASAGYWGIANAARVASTSLSAYDASLAAGLVEAALQLHDQPDAPVLMVCFDVMTQPPLSLARPVSIPFAVAWLLGRDPTCSLGQLTLNPFAAPGETALQGALESMRRANPAARALPLLEPVARQTAGTVTLPMPSGQYGLAVDFEPAET